MPCLPSAAAGGVSVDDFLEFREKVTENGQKLMTVVQTNVQLAK